MNTQCYFDKDIHNYITISFPQEFWSTSASKWMAAQLPPRAALAVPPFSVLGFRGSHLSNTTCLTQVFFKSGESCSKLWRSVILHTQRMKQTRHQTCGVRTDAKCPPKQPPSSQPAARLCADPNFFNIQLGKTFSTSWFKYLITIYVPRGFLPSGLSAEAARPRPGSVWTPTILFTMCNSIYISIYLFITGTTLLTYRLYVGQAPRGLRQGPLRPGREARRAPLEAAAAAVDTIVCVFRLF